MESTIGTTPDSVIVCPPVGLGPSGRWARSITGRQADFVARAVMVGVLSAVIGLAGGCLEDAEGDPEVELPAAAAPSECRGRLGVMVVVNASGRDVVRVRLVDLEGPAPELELNSKERRGNISRYEVLRQDCGPRPHRQRVLINLADGQQHQGEISLEWNDSSWVVVTTTGIL